MDISTFDSTRHCQVMVQELLQQTKLAQVEGAAENRPSQEEAARVARGFEALFIHELYKTMRQAMLDNDTGDDEDLSFGADILNSIGGIELAEQLSHIGKGIGIAQLVYRHLTGEDTMPTITCTRKSHPPTPSPMEKSSPPQRELNDNEKNNTDIVSRIHARLTAFAPTIEQVANHFNIPSWLIKAVIATESAGIPTAVSPAGAKGLMQLIDSTASQLGLRNVFDPVENIWGGTRYLRQMLDRFGSIPLALAAYNAGPGAVIRYGGIPPYPETQQYIRRVQLYAQQFQHNA